VTMTSVAVFAARKFVHDYVYILNEKWILNGKTNELDFSRTDHKQAKPLKDYHHERERWFICPNAKAANVKPHLISLQFPSRGDIRIFIAEELEKRIKLRNLLISIWIEHGMNIIAIPLF
jgi:phosphopantetheine adenylyltransferase